MAETKEVPVHLLAQLLQDHEKVKQLEERDAEDSIRSLDSTSVLVNSWGPLMVALGVCAAAAAPELGFVGWIYGDLLSVLLGIVGKLGVVAGGGLTAKAMYNHWASKKRAEHQALLGRREVLQLTAE
jgi:hypothetical protein